MTSDGRPYRRACHYCGRDVLLAPTVAGHWRAFDLVPLPPGPDTWGWRKSARGMIADSPVEGLGLHVCAEYLATLNDVQRLDPAAVLGVTDYPE